MLCFNIKCGLVGLLGLRLNMAAAQEANLQKQVLSTVMYALNGDHTPNIWPLLPILTPLGANQLYDVGSRLRRMYVIPPGVVSVTSTQVLNLNPHQLTADDLEIWTTDEQYTIASAQAFMQGLYPPLTLDLGYVYIEQQSSLANGTNIIAPLNAYQYPHVLSTSLCDHDSIWVRGMDECPAHDTSVGLWRNSPQYTNTASNAQEFYNGIQENILDGVITDARFGIFDAFTIWAVCNTLRSTMRV